MRRRLFLIQFGLKAYHGIFCYLGGAITVSYINIVAFAFA